MAPVERDGNYKVGKEGAEVSGRPQTMVKSRQCVLSGQDVMLSSPRDVQRRSRLLATMRTKRSGQWWGRNERDRVGARRHHLHGVRGLDLLKKLLPSQAVLSLLYNDLGTDAYDNVRMWSLGKCRAVIYSNLQDILRILQLTYITPLTNPHRLFLHRWKYRYKSYVQDLYRDLLLNSHVSSIGYVLFRG